MKSFPSAARLGFDFAICACWHLKCPPQPERPPSTEIIFSCTKIESDVAADVTKIRPGFGAPRDALVILLKTRGKFWCLVCDSAVAARRTLRNHAQTAVAVDVEIGEPASVGEAVCVDRDLFRFAGRDHQLERLAVTLDIADGPQRNPR